MLEPLRGVPWCFSRQEKSVRVFGCILLAGTCAVCPPMCNSRCWSGLVLCEHYSKGTSPSMSLPALLASQTITIRPVGPPHDTMTSICYEVPYMPANARFRDDRFRSIRHRCLNYYFKTTVTLFERSAHINIKLTYGPRCPTHWASIAAQGGPRTRKNDPRVVFV